MEDEVVEVKKEKKSKKKTKSKAIEAVEDTLNDLADAGLVTPETVSEVTENEPLEKVEEPVEEVVLVQEEVPSAETKKAGKKEKEVVVTNTPKKTAADKMAKVLRWRGGHRTK